MFEKAIIPPLERENDFLSPPPLFVLSLVGGLGLDSVGSCPAFVLT